LCDAILKLWIFLYELSGMIDVVRTNRFFLHRRTNRIYRWFYQNL